MKKRGWLYRLFNDLFEVTIWLTEDSGNTTAVEYKLQRLDKITHSYLKGVDINGLKIEFRSVTPFDYFIKKI